MADTANRRHKDTLFVDLFCDDEKDGRRNFLELYNALHGTHLRPETTQMRDVRIDGVLYSTLRNDVSMLVDGRVVVLCEQQSTINENMPLRCLMYIARIYEGLLEARDRFKRRLQRIPAPEFFVFYNGTDSLPERQELQLKDAFLSAGPGQNFPLNLTVTVYNVNRPTGKALWEQCRALTDYSKLIRIIREEQEKQKDGFMGRAVRRAMKAGLLAGYLSRKAKEIENMFFGEYDYATDVAVQREEAREEGIAIGEERGIAIGEERGIAQGERNAKLEAARKLLAMHLGTVEQIAQAQGLNLEEVQQLASRQEV